MRYTGVILVMLAAFFWGISGGIGDILMNRGWDPIVISFYRGAIGFVCFSLWFLFHKELKWEISTRLVMWSLLAGIGVAGNFTFYFLSIEDSSISVAATLMYAAPVFVLLTSILLLLERSTWFKWLCIAGVVMGIILLTGAYNAGDSSVTLFGAATGLMAGVSYAVFIFGFRNAALIGKPPTTLTIAFFSFCFILFLFMDKTVALDVLSSSDIGWFLLVGIAGAGVPFIFYVFGLRRTAPTTASMVAMIEPVTASLFGLLIMGNQLSAIQFSGMGLILFTITFLSVRQSE